MDERDLGRLEAKVDGLAAAFEDFREETRGWRKEVVEKRLDSHSARLQALERWRAWIAGGLAVLAVVWGAVIVWVRGQR